LPRLIQDDTPQICADQDEIRRVAAAHPESRSGG
jgi:hypothetical protein